MKEHYVVVVTTAPALHTATRVLATRLAGRSNAVLLFLHVVPLQPADGEAMLHAAVGLSRGEAEAWLRRQTPSDDSVPFRHRLEVGEPEELVARFVRDHAVDLVVAEEPPRSWLSETLWRGLAERLIRRVACPVVIGGPGFLRTDEAEVLTLRSPLRDTNVADLLNALVEARVAALRCWLDQAADAARRIAGSESLQTAALLAARGPLSPREVRRLQVELGEHRRALRALGWQLSFGPQVWTEDWVPPLPGRASMDFRQRVQVLGHSASLPLAVDEARDRLVILAGASLADGAGSLLFAFDAASDFLRILGQPGPLPSFETYAFDDEGWMLSTSRFPEHLRDAGLLPAAGAQTPLRLRVLEPSEGPVESWPLTLMAREAIHQHDGSNTRGYRDYRGTPVVGAWRWVPEYGFGVTAEVDRDVARG